MGLDCTVEDIEKAGAVALNLVIREEAEEAAQIIEEKCGTPYIKGAPYGYKGTLEWLESISTVINRQINPTLVKRLCEKQMSLMPMGGPMMMGFSGMPKKPPSQNLGLMSQKWFAATPSRQPRIPTRKSNISKAKRNG